MTIMSLEDFKRELKTWESHFLVQTGRKPDKEDLKEAPTNIKDAYRNYWKMKKVVSEEQNFHLAKDVWSVKLNKSIAKTTTAVKKNVLQKFGEKLKLHNDVNMKCYRNLNHLSPSDIVSNGTENKMIKSGNVLRTEELVDTICQLEKDDVPLFTSGNFKKCDRTEMHRSIKELNPLSSLSTKKKLHYNKNVNHSWLKRCSLEIDNSISEIDSSDAMDKSVDLNVCESFKESMAETNCSVDTNSSLPQKALCSIVNSPKIDVVENRVEVPYKHSENTNNDLGVKDVCNNKRARTVSESKCESLKAVKETLNLFKSDNTEDSPVRKKKKISKDSGINCDTSTSKKSAHLKKKISSGTLNENFVKLDIKKKVFVRGHRHVNVRKLKYKKWKQLKQQNSGGEIKSVKSTACFKCGDIGHWARNCPSTKGTLLPDTLEDFEFTLPTLEEAAEMCKGIKTSSNNGSKGTTKIYETKVIEDTDTCSLDDIVEWNSDSNVFTPEVSHSGLPPYFDSQPEDMPKLVYDALKKFGYSKFRSGQGDAIIRILSGKSTLVVLPTGSGKSLCYQLPAYLYSQKSSCISIVVSPLVSLMEDQITGLPKCLKAVCLHSGMSQTQRESCYEAISNGNVQILLVSPEAIINGRYIPTNLPPIAFACIDEAHCLSEWSHNFRPSYLQLFKVLNRKYQVHCILGLTATATQNTASDIAHHLKLSNSDESVIGKTNIPDNIHISVSCDKDKDEALLKLLKSERFSSFASIIIYCIRRDETERLATFIRTCLQELANPEEITENKTKGKRKKSSHLVWDAEAYHAGLTPAKRRSVQKRFMSGKLRVVVATVAFGMGLDKSDVGAVIHFNMPKSFESYVQEIGRAGRDGSDAHCHLFLEREGKDMCELKRHIYSNGIDRHTVKKLLRKVFVPCKCAKLQQMYKESNEKSETCDTSFESCPKHEVAFSVESMVQELDLKEENISTLLCYLELHPKHWIEQLAPAYSICTIRCYGGIQQMFSLTKKCAPIAVAMALDKQNGREWQKAAQYEFQIIDVASQMGWESGALKRELKRLEWDDVKKKKTGVMIEFSNLAFHLQAPGNLKDEDLDYILDFLYRKITLQEKRELQKLYRLYSMFSQYSSSHYWKCCDEFNEEKSVAIKEEVKRYFERHNSDDNEENEFENSVPGNSDEIVDSVILNDIKQHIRDMISVNHDQKFSGRAIARIFHGIDSPCYPAKVWGRVYRFWRCHLNDNFHTILRLANEQLRKM